jgi:hypothetical protein
MKKQLQLFIWLLPFLALVSSCLFQPDVNVAISTKSPSGGPVIPRRVYLSLLKTQAHHTAAVDELRDMAAKLLASEAGGENRSAVLTTPSRITGVNKLAGIGGQEFLVSSTSRAAGVMKEDPVEIYAFTTEKPGTDTPGFVLTCNDNRIGNILAIVDQGAPESVDVPFLNMYYTNLQAYIEHTVAEYESITDEEIKQVVAAVKRQNVNRSSIRGSGYSYYQGDGYYVEEGYSDVNGVEYGLGITMWEGIGYMGTGYFGSFDIPGYDLPVLMAVWNWEGGDYATLPTEWDQVKPYNYIFTEYISLPDDFLVTGCGPTALAQVMAYYKYPPAYTYVDPDPNAPDYFGTVYDWAALTEYPVVDIENQELKENVSILMYEIGKRAEADNVAPQTPYEKARTTTWEWSLIQALEEMGYNVPEYSSENGKKAFQPYNFDTVLLSIIDEKPVIVSGYATEELNEEGQYEHDYGHVWVIDGTRYMSYAETFSTGTIAYMGLDTWVHCNIGGGPLEDNDIRSNRLNGWYRSDVFDLSVDTGHVSFIRSLEEEEPLNFQYKIQILPFVSPLEEEEEE